jgi:hypothetical protein
MKLLQNEVAVDMFACHMVVSQLPLATLLVILPHADAITVIVFHDYSRVKLNV